MSIKKLNGILWSNVKKVNGIAVASIKKINEVLASVVWDGYYYKKGDEYTDITGGWESYQTAGSNQFTATKNADNLELEVVNTSSNAIRGVFYTSSTINVTNIDTLKFDIDVEAYGTNSTIRVGLASAQQNNDFYSEPAGYVAYTATGRSTKSLDVSSFSGSYYIKLYISLGTSGQTCRYLTYNVWGE